MNDSFLKQFKPRSAVESLRGGDDDDDAVDDFAAFGFLRGARERALMLEIRKRSGDIVALAYALLERMDYDASGALTLLFAGQSVIRIIGRNLNSEIRPNVRLLDAILRHKATWIQESGSAAAMAADEHAVVIERIEFS
jgi:hypothetical protein